MSDEVIQRLEALAAAVAKLAPAPTPTVTVTELACDYMQSIEFKSLKARETEERRICLHLVRLLGAVPVMALRDEIPRYRDARSQETIRGRGRTGKTKPATRNREVTRLLAMCSWGVEYKRIPSNPLAGISMEPEENIRQTCPTPFDVEAAIAFARGPRLKAMIALKFASGLRRAEVCHLRLQQLDLEHGLIDLGHRDTKTKRPRLAPVTDGACKLVREYLRGRDKDSPYVFATRSGKPVGPRNFLRDFQRTCRKAGLVAAAGERYCLHDLRAGFACHQLELKTPERVVMDMGGWKSHVAFDRYVRVRPEWVLEAKMRADIAASTPRRPPHRLRLVKAEQISLDRNQGEGLG